MARTEQEAFWPPEEKNFWNCWHSPLTSPLQLAIILWTWCTFHTYVHFLIDLNMIVHREVNYRLCDWMLSRVLENNEEGGALEGGSVLLLSHQTTLPILQQAQKWQVHEAVGMNT